MLKPKPFKDAEVNPEPPKRDLQDFLELFFSFLWFHHKLIIGFILLTAIGFWIYNISTTPKKVVESDRAPAVERTDEIKVPSADLDFSASEKTDPTPEIVDPTLEAFDPSSDTSDPATNNTEPPAKNVAAVAEAKNPASASSNLLVTGTVNDLIEKSLEIDATWGRALPSVGLVMCSQRARISRRLLEMELSDAERTFAMTSYIESISLVDSLNVASKMKLSGTRDALNEIDRIYSNHPDPTIFAKANLAITLAPLYDFIATSDVESLKQFQLQVALRIDKIAPDQAAFARLAELAVAMNNKPGLPEEREAVMADLADRMDQIDTPSAKFVADKFRERYLFDRFDPGSLVERVMIQSPGARDKVQAYYQVLADNPNSSREIYQVALSLIRAYRQLEQVDDANALKKWIDAISENITNENNRKVVKDAIKNL